jgi:Arc/MetJ-type ribon-helix-helix transcriptional regulator
MLREEHRLRVSDNTLSRRIFGSKSEAVREGWRELHNEEPQDLDSSPNSSIFMVIKSRSMRWVM